MIRLRGELDLVAVVPQRPRLTQLRPRGFRSRVTRSMIGRGAAPRLASPATARGPRRPARCGHVGAGANRAPPPPRQARTRTSDVRGPCGSADGCPLRWRRQLHRGDQLAGLQHRVALGLVPRQPVKARDRDRARAVPAVHVHARLERGQRHRHVGRMRRDAQLGVAEISRGCECSPSRGGAAAARRGVCCTAWSRRRSTGSACAEAGCLRPSRGCEADPTRRAARASERTGYRSRTRGSAARSLLVTAAPIRSPPSSVSSMLS